MVGNDSLVNLAQGDTTLALALIFCVIFLALGMKNAPFMMMAGIVWISVAITVFIGYGQLFLLIGLGTGFILMLEGGLRQWS